MRRLVAPAAFVVLSVATTALASMLAGRGPGVGFLDAFVGSGISADYSADEKVLLIPPLNSGIIDEIRQDNSERRGDSGQPVDGGTPPAPSPEGPGRTPGPVIPLSPTPAPTPTLPVPTPTLPVPTPTLSPLSTLPPLPTPTLSPLPTLPPLP